MIVIEINNGDNRTSFDLGNHFLGYDYRDNNNKMHKGKIIKFINNNMRGIGILDDGII